MAKFKYKARQKADNKEVNGEIDALDERAALRQLDAAGLVPLEVSAKQSSSLFARFNNKISTKEKVVFARQLSTLVTASLPLLQALRMVASQTENKAFKEVIDQIATDIEGGMSFSKALSKHPEVFNPIFQGVVSAGEASGTLDKSLERLADQQERDSEISGKVKGAMVYPAIVLIVMLLVITFMVVKVLPQVQSMYSGFGQKLPLITSVLLAMAHAVTHFWWIALIVGGFIWYFGRRWMQSASGRSTIDNFLLKGPVAGPLFMKLYMARFARVCSTLLASGLPLLQVLSITADAIGNVHVKASITSAAEKVRGGKALSETLVDDPHFLPLVPSMLRIGEQSGAIETMMAKTADYYEKEVSGQINTLSTTLEPILMVVMGVMALIVVAAILLPIYGLVGKSLNVV